MVTAMTSIDTGTRTAELFALLQDTLGDILDEPPPCPRGAHTPRRYDTERNMILTQALAHLTPADEAARLEHAITVLSEIHGLGRISAICLLYNAGRILAGAPRRPR